MSDKEKVIMTGNQAIARGFYEAGGLVAASYPGSPTVEILETANQYPEIDAAFSTNEKVALETAIGASFAGVRAMVSMKHVGVNIAADPLLTFTQTPVRGGFLLVSGDDPGMHSSQNEQDNRNLAKFANMAVVVPGDSQEAKEYTKKALELSEKYAMPMMLQITSRACHSRCLVETGKREEVIQDEFPRDVPSYAMIPPNTFDKQYAMKERLERIVADGEAEKWCQMEENDQAETLIVTAGLPYYHLKEIEEKLKPVSILKLGMVYPLPLNHLKELIQPYKQVIVIEEMTPFIENELVLANISCQGKKYFSFTGELDSQEILAGLRNAGLAREMSVVSRQEEEVEKEKVTPRPPLFCPGCPHRPVFDILKKSKVMVNNDIGCYSMGLFPPFEASHSLISMGATIGISTGMLKANRKAGREIPLVSVIGDGTFFHSGMPGMVNLMDHLEPEDNLTIILLDNGTTAMTGGQKNASTGKRMTEKEKHIHIPSLIKEMGIEEVQILDQFRYKETSDAVKKAIKTPGLSVLVMTRPCALHFKIKEPVFYVEPETCIGCRTCIKTNCPPLRMKKYEGQEKEKSSIDPSMCVGCSICAQVCPVNAIKRREGRGTNEAN
ncbi:indolepyruvate ferredoxin oxidoreductase alpha subunit [Tindallia magadiensis]|uniref:Indolepyruvate oxidoreductase subunit IorA n=1 Tax=Tindallia magadiensis TaxID=69895 RepID=A0A1I3E606_9FIRM|nr:indolepyruvate ferredoxin oxidoreductase subunit alpha [Tindallia magadiensis]SFH94394.1 indolepyruvate ferredoxin oxidoreductase alpha subunit [Tindallia magadiensis]